MPMQIELACSVNLEMARISHRQFYLYFTGRDLTAIREAGVFGRFCAAAIY